LKAIEDLKGTTTTTEESRYSRKELRVQRKAQVQSFLFLGMERVKIHLVERGGGCRTAAQFSSSEGEIGIEDSARPR